MKGSSLLEEKDSADYTNSSMGKFSLTKMIGKKKQGIKGRGERIGYALICTNFHEIGEWEFSGSNDRCWILWSYAEIFFDTSPRIILRSPHSAPNLITRLRSRFQCCGALDRVGLGCLVSLLRSLPEIGRFRFLRVLWCSRSVPEVYQPKCLFFRQSGPFRHR
jgi:hypothetical protein